MIPSSETPLMPGKADELPTVASSSLKILVFADDRAQSEQAQNLAFYLSSLCENPNLDLTILAPNGSALASMAAEAELTHYPISDFGRSLLRRTPQLWPIFTAMRRHSYDVAITHKGYAIRGLSIIAKRVISICHDDDFDAHYFAKELLTPSSNAADKATTLLQDGCQVESLPYPYISQAKAIKPIPTQKPLTIGASAAFVEENALAVFLHMAQLVIQERPDARFLLAGEGPEDQDLKELSEQIAPFVEFPGRLSDEELAGQIDIYCQTSRHEAFGQTLCAMMDHGIACIATCTNGAMDILKGGMVAPLVPIDDALAMTERVLKMLEDIDHLQQIKQACFQRIREEDFEYRVFSSRLHEIIERERLS